MIHHKQIYCVTFNGVQFNTIWICHQFDTGLGLSLLRSMLSTALSQKLVYV